MLLLLLDLPESFSTVPSAAVPPADAARVAKRPMVCVCYGRWRMGQLPGTVVPSHASHHHPASPLDLDLARARSLASLLSGRFFITSCGFQLRFAMAVFFIFVVDETITVGSDRYYNPSLALLCHHSFSVGQS